MKKYERKITNTIKIGNITIGGQNKVAIQSMTTTDTKDIEATVNQINELENAGCEIVRVAVPDEKGAKAIEQIKSKINIPLVADIHFDYRLALEAIKNGADKIRINPGNIGDKKRVELVVNEAQKTKIPIRIGVNSGSVEKDILKKHKKPVAQALVESAQRNVNLLESFDFYNIVISLKASHVSTMVDSYRLASQKFNYPLHLGVTEAGTLQSGTVKSSVGIGTLLMEGIGDTIRVSLTGNPINEIIVAKRILKACGQVEEGIELISCPTCGRCRINLIHIADEVEKKISSIEKNIKVAVMGCEVNGPGEAKEADIGIAGGKGVGLIFKKGEIIEKVSEGDLVERLIYHIQSM